jgi:CMP-N,N'-diacetyllegionaminic acid synthase
MICIIPARKGSQGLKNKNILKFNKINLFLHTIKQAQQCKEISKIVLTTDDMRIIKITKLFKKDKIEIPFIRPKKLSRKNSSARDVYLHCIKYLENRDLIKIDNFCVLLPTSPLRTAGDIKNTIQLFKKKKAEVCLSVSETKPRNWIFKLDKNKVKLFSNEQKKSSIRQFETKNFIANGSIYVFDHNYLKKNNTYFSKKTYGYIMPKLRSVDIDNYDDFKIAELIKKYL